MPSLELMQPGGAVGDLLTCLDDYERAMDGVLDVECDALLYQRTAASFERLKEMVLASPEAHGCWVGLLAGRCAVLTEHWQMLVHRDSNLELARTLDKHKAALQALRARLTGRASHGG